MKNGALLSIGSLATLLTIGPAFGQTPSPPMPQDTPAAAPAEKPGRLEMPHRVMGEVVSSDEGAKTLTVRNAKGKELTFNAESDAATHLGALKPGDRIRVTYKRNHGQLVATHIVERPATKAER